MMLVAAGIVIGSVISAIIICALVNLIISDECARLEEKIDHLLRK